MHLTLMRRDLYEAHPWIAVALAEAFAEAKRLGWQRLRRARRRSGVMLPWLTRDLEEIAEVMGPDHWRYGFAENREILAGDVPVQLRAGPVGASARHPRSSSRPMTHDARRSNQRRPGQ